MKIFRGKTSNGSLKAQSQTSQKYLRDNLLKKYPIRLDEWEEDKIVRIIRPKFKTRIGKGFSKIFNITPTYTIKLDNYGSFVWKLCDGKTSVDEIGKILKMKFGEDVEPLYNKLSVYFNIMEINDMLKLKDTKYS